MLAVDCRGGELEWIEQRAVPSHGRPRSPSSAADLGLGWLRRPADRNTRPGFVEHWGTGGGFRNAMRLYPELGLGIVVMANTTHAYDHHQLMNAYVTAFTR